MSINPNKLPFGAEGTHFNFPQNSWKLSEDDKVVMKSLSGRRKVTAHICQCYLASHASLRTIAAAASDKLTALMRFDPVEFMVRFEAFCRGEKNDDNSGFNNGLLFETLNTEVEAYAPSPCHVLIVDPPATFVQCLNENHWPKHCSITVCMANKDVAKIYRLDPALHQFNIIPMEEMTGAITYTHALVFASSLERKSLLATLRKLFSVVCQPGCKTYVEFPATYLTGRDSFALRYYLFNEQPLDHILVVDRNATNGESKMRCVLTYGDPSLDIYLQRADLVNDRALVLSEYFSISLIQLMGTDKSVHEIFGDLMKEKYSHGGRNAAKEKVFSKYISLFHRTEKRGDEKIRVVAYYRRVGSKAQIRKNASSKGKRLGKDWCSSDMGSDLSPLDFVHNLLWEKSMVKMIKKDILNHVPAENLDIKTIWYFYHEDLLKDSRYSENVCKAFFESLTTCDLFYHLGLGDMDKANITEALRDYQQRHGVASDEMKTIENQLRWVLNQAVKNKLCESNPIKDLQAQQDAQNKPRRDLHEAATLRAIEPDSWEQLSEYQNKNEDLMRDAFIELKAHLGLPTAIIGGLTLGDVRTKSPFLDFPVLSISKQLPKKGIVPVPFASVSKNRVVSLPDVATRFYRYYEETMAAAIASGIEEPEALPLFSGEKDLRVSLTINRLNLIAKKAKSALDIQKYSVLFPDGEKMIKEDLNRYQGDIFRAFYEMRLRNTVLRSADREYLYGTTLHGVTYTNYRDYLHPGTQISLHQIQNRCADLKIVDSVPIDTSKKEFRLARGWKKSLTIDTPGVRTETTITVKIPPHAKLKSLKASVRCRYGMDIITTFNPNS